jgi:AraC-like DNA-binding protein
MNASEMPTGVRLVRHEIATKRITVRNRRTYSNVRNITAKWPQDGLHELNKYALVCVLSGHIDYQLGNYKLQCGPGHFIFIPPGTPFPNGSRTFVDLEKSTSCDILVFLQHPAALECWISHGHPGGREQSDNWLILHERCVHLFHALMEEVVQEAMEDKRRAQVVAEGLLLALLHVLEREVEAERLQYIRAKYPLDQSEIGFGPSVKADFKTRLEQYVEANLRKPLTIERVAREMYLSPAQLTRNVRRDTGVTFNQLLARHRLEEAKKLLRDSEWTIAAVANLAGFHSTKYFYSFFKKHVGETPLEFRMKSNRAKTNPKK